MKNEELKMSISLRMFQLTDLIYIPAASPEDCRASLTLGPSWTAVNAAAVPIACGGVRVYWRRMGELWIAVNPQLAQTHKIALLRAMRILINSTACNMRLTRLQAIFEADRKDSERCAKFIGLEPEAALRSYGPNGKDSFIYSKILTAPQERNTST